MYRGDIRIGQTIDFKFSTVATTGAPTTLAGSPAVAAYVGNGTTEITAGITLTVDFDGRTGLHNVSVVASSGNGFATATDVQLVITAGTVGGTSVVGYVIAEFSIENRLPLSVGSVTGAVGSVTGAVGSVTGSVGSVTGLTASDVGAIKTKTDTIPGSPAAVGSAMTLTAGERDSVADAHLNRVDGIEVGLTPKGAHRLEAAAAAGKISGAATTTVTIRNAVADTKDRLIATVDSSGNRSAVTADVT